MLDNCINSALYRIFHVDHQHLLLHEAVFEYSFLADRTNGRAIATLLRLSSVVCRRLSVCL